MANEIITTALTASYGLDDRDILYIAEGGQILTTGFSSALTNTLAASDTLNILVDGKVIALSSAAISLTSTSSSAVAFDNLSIGETGVVHSVTSTAIFIKRSAELIRNEGSVFGGGTGIVSLGRTNSILNTGTVSGGKAISMEGGNSSLTNTGLLSGDLIAVDMRGDGDISNMGQILADMNGLGGSDIGAVQHQAFSTASDTNSGTIQSTGGSGIFVGADSNFRSYILSNAGSIHGHSFGMLFTYSLQTIQPTSRITILNSGQVTALNSAITIAKTATDGTMNGFAAEIINTAQGTIASTGNGITGGTIAFSGSLRVNNAGSILASGVTSIDGTAAIRVNGTDSATLRLVNTGLISGFVTAIDMNLESLNALTLFNQGEIFGRVLCGGSSDFIHNRGTMDGILTGGGADTIRNLGLLNGVVDMGDGADLYDGRFGSSTFSVNAGTGNDTLKGGLGDDTLNGGNDDDLVLGGAGDDSLSGDNGNDTLQGGAGNDELIDEEGTDQLFDQEGNDTLTGGAGDQTLSGGEGNDVLNGGANNDVLGGGTGDDQLFGGTGSDRLNGGEGNDRLQADSFDATGLADTLTGGLGQDVFVFISASDIGNTATTRDRITDFTVGSDQINLAAFMANARYIGANAYSTAATGEVRFVAATGLLSGDVNGDGVGDWQIKLTANLALTAADFIF